MGTTASIIAGKISRLRQCQDFQQRPVRAVVRRLLWRARWNVTRRPWRLKLGDDLDILAPQGGSAANVYLLGYSEPETARFAIDFLKPGMIFWDVGAHVGEYTLLVARGVGETGRVEAFEPQPDIFEFLAHNMAAHSLRNVRLHRAAVSDQAGFAELLIHQDPSLSHLHAEEPPPAKRDVISVPTMSLDDFHLRCGNAPHLVKVDVEGAERLVLRGAESLLRLEPEAAPAWVMEYAPENCKKFGYHPDELIAAFNASQHKTYWLAATGGLVPTTCPRPWPTWGNIVASKRELMV